jgi:segregation and condensation protein B
MTRSNENAASESSRPDKVLKQHLKGIIEALLFASSEPITLEKIREVTDTFQPCKPKVILEVIQELKYDYLAQQRAFRLEEIAGGYALRTCLEYQSYIDLLLREKRGERLSQAALEVLSIIAHRQPVTRAVVESIRGVDSSGVIQMLLERQLIQISGKLETVGRPTLYSVTDEFLSHFGIRDLKEVQD